MLSKEAIYEILKNIKYPGFSRDIVSFGLIKNILIKDNQIALDLNISTHNPSIPSKIKEDIIYLLKQESEIADIQVNLNIAEPKTALVENTKPSQMENIRYIVAIASGKGGVGKSTITTNLACAFQEILKPLGKSVGILDCDIYGPSIPLMMGAQVFPELENELLVPVESFGIKIMSMGCLIDEDTPVVWRGPMIMKTIRQFASDVAWKDLEILLVDLPPGTGDAQLSLVQTIPLNGAIIVSTPQVAAMNVARRGAMMFPKVNVPFLGVIENMSDFKNPSTNELISIFGSGAGKAIARALSTDLLGSIPLDPSMREGADQGIPILISHPESYTSSLFLNIASSILDKLNQSLSNTK